MVEAQRAHGFKSTAPKMGALSRTVEKISSIEKSNIELK